MSAPRRPWWSHADGQTRLCIWARPGARREAVLGVKADAAGQLWLQVAVKAVAEDGRANDALIAFLAEKLGVRQGTIRLAGGQTSRQKRLTVDETLPAAMLEALAAVAEGSGKK